MILKPPLVVTTVLQSPSFKRTRVQMSAISNVTAWPQSALRQLKVLPQAGSRPGVITGFWALNILVKKKKKNNDFEKDCSL